MSSITNKPSVYTQLRDKAEAQLQAGTTTTASHWSVGVDALRLLHRLSSDPDHAEDALKLLHELQVHQVELDLQSEEIAANERILVEDLALYRRLYDCAPFGYFLIDFDGKVVQCNHAAAELLGVDIDGLDGQSLDAFVLADSRPRLLALLQRVAQSGTRESCVAETKGHPQDARHVQFLASMPPEGEHILLACCACASPDTPCQ
ncbi:PAS domain-containing protein [Halomonas mongoliensis]|uniref:PAS domain-containing protein n=1 Tax=Halomonas mongoliensis TaxID=321265 RepID=A0ABU1GQM8_9GAMM|nr:PAS domain-containing protein [Halomonas mongoliensis]MDR5894344.1 PAS domain-containing protein [Halomonas mongoliensis]